MLKWARESESGNYRAVKKIRQGYKIKKEGRKCGWWEKAVRRDKEEIVKRKNITINFWVIINIENHCFCPNCNKKII